MYQYENETLKKIHNINLELLLRVDEICKANSIQYYLSYGALLGAVRHKNFIPWDNDVDICITRKEFNKLLPHLYKLDSEKYQVILPSDFKEKYFDSHARLIYKKADIKMDPEYCKYYNGWVNKIALDFFFIDPIPEGIKKQITIFELKLLYGMANAHRYKLETDNYRGIVKIASHILYAIGKCISADTIRRITTKLAVNLIDESKATNYTISTGMLQTLDMRFPIEYYKDVTYLPIGEYLFPAPGGYKELLTMIYNDYMELPPEEDRIPHWGHIAIKPENFIFYDNE